MASLASKKNGNGKRAYYIVWYHEKHRQPLIYLGDVSKETAGKIKARVEDLIAAKKGGVSVPAATSAWLAKIDADLADKLLKAGLIDEVPQAKAATKTKATLESFLTSYIEGRAKLKPSTRTNFEHAKRRLIDFFGSDKRIAKITPGDAEDWREWLRKSLAENTIRRCCGRARQFFKYAVKHKLVSENPFAEMGDVQVKSNGSRIRFITREEAQKVIDACPDNQWKLLFALSRFGGLRCPSEHVRLRWSDVDWANNKFTVHSPKTEHHEGHDKRDVPIFPELRPYLEAAYAERGDSEYVITIRTMRGSDPQPRTTMKKIVKRAGLTPWPKLFQNLRSTRQTELTDQYPAHVVCKWIGNSEIVAKEHYLQVTQDKFTETAGSGVKNAPEDARTVSTRLRQGSPRAEPFTE